MRIRREAFVGWVGERRLDVPSRRARTARVIESRSPTAKVTCVAGRPYAFLLAGRRASEAPHVSDTQSVKRSGTFEQRGKLGPAALYAPLTDDLEAVVHVEVDVVRLRGLEVDVLSGSRGLV